MKQLSKLVAATALVSVMAAPAFAQEVTAGDTYFKLFGGAVIMDDVNGTSGGVPVEIEFDTGWTIGGAVGYNLSPQLALEGELSYLTADLDSGTAGGVTVSIDGDYSTFLALANIVFHPFADAGFDPYIGAGAGVAIAELDINSIGGVAVNSSESSEDLALQGTAGLDFDIGTGSSIGAQYRYLWTDTGSGNTDEISGHLFTVQFTTAF